MMNCRCAAPSPGHGAGRARSRLAAARIGMGPAIAAAALAAAQPSAAQPSAAQPSAPAAAVSIPELDRLNASVRQLVAAAEPAVVQVFSTRQGTVASPDQNLFAREFGTGSGVILDESGYIITNAHVVEGARRVQVLLNRAGGGAGAPGESILEPRGELIGARVVSMDRETDLALLKIARSGLPFLELADSDRLRKGDVVVAFGSPLGLASSVSMGVVSSVARQLLPDDPMIYLQTDAAINPGNSGGPLVDATGRVVGINTFIFSQSGGSEGLGFAVPSNIVKNVYRQMRLSGVVRRGEIGVNAQTLNPLLAAGLGLSRDWGVLLGDVAPNGPADRAGLRAGDIVLRVNGKVMENGRQMSVNLYGLSAGDRVELEILRDGASRNVTVEVAERPRDPGSFGPLARPERNTVPRLGIIGLDLSEVPGPVRPQVRKRAGVVVVAVLSDMWSWEGGFLRGDVIYALNGREVNSLEDLRSAVDALETGAAAVAHVERGGRLSYLAFSLDH